MTTPIPSSALFHHHRGFTLIEVLITIIILAIGLLGLAALQLNALRNNTTAYERTQATMLAYDIVDRMRANRDAANAGSYNTALDTTPPAQNCTGTGQNCSNIELAQHDLSLWKCSLGKFNSNGVCTGLGMTGALPNGDGSVVLNGTLVTVTITWEEKRGQTANQTTSLAVSTLL